MTRDEPISAWMRPPDTPEGPKLSPEHSRRLLEQSLAELDAYHDEAGARIRERLGIRPRG